MGTQYLKIVVGWESHGDFLKSVLRILIRGANAPTKPPTVSPDTVLRGRRERVRSRVEKEKPPDRA